MGSWNLPRNSESRIAIARFENRATLANAGHAPLGLPPGAGEGAGEGLQPTELEGVATRQPGPAAR